MAINKEPILPTREMVLEILAPMGIPYNRARDLAARFVSGNLTTIEQLALLVLQGGPNGEDPRGLLDKAIEEWSHGSYRVPVRVISDLGKTLFVLSCPHRLDSRGRENILRIFNEHVRNFNKGSYSILVDGGMSLEVYEVQGKTDGPSVELQNILEGRPNE